MPSTLLLRLLGEGAFSVWGGEAAFALVAGFLAAFFEPADCCFCPAIPAVLSELLLEFLETFPLEQLL